MKSINSPMKTILIAFTCLLGSHMVWSQDALTLDKTIARIGEDYILLSDLEYRFREEALASGNSSLEAKCQLFYLMVVEKIMIVQAARDSITVTKEEVDMQMEQRMAFFINQFGSEKAIEKYFGEPMAAIREKLRKNLEDQLLVGRMQQSIVEGLNISPREVQDFFKSMPQDSIPVIETQFELGQIVLDIPISDKEKKRVKATLSRIRKQIMSGELEWSIAATLYSEDPGSKARGGDLGWAARNAYVPEFSAAAFKLKKDSISGPVETQFGFHIIQMIDRKGDRIHLKHILISPKPRPDNRKYARAKLDSIRLLIQRDSLDFPTAAYRFSQDEETKNTGGLVYDPQTGSSKVAKSSLGADLLLLLDTMKVGSISLPQGFVNPSNKEAYRLLYLKERTEEHKANPQKDYAYLAELAKAKKGQEVINQWVWQKAPSIYISIDPAYLQSCPKVKKLVENKRSNQ